jgi:hypothetical protein
MRQMGDRAQSIGLARFVLCLIVGAFVVWIVRSLSTRILPGAKTATNSTKANQATTWLQQGVDWLPIALLLIAFFGIVVLAIYQREVLR